MSKLAFHHRAKLRERSRLHNRQVKYDHYFSNDDMDEYDTIPFSTVSTSTIKRRSYDNIQEICISPPRHNTQLVIPNSKEKKRHHNELLSSKQSLDISTRSLPSSFPLSNMNTSASSIMRNSDIEFCFPKKSPASSFDILEDKIIDQVYAALYSHSTQISSSSSEGGSLDNSTHSSSISTQVLTPVDFQWFKKTLRPFLARMKHRSIQKLLAIENNSNVPTSVTPIHKIPSFESFGIVPLVSHSGATPSSTSSIPSFEKFAPPISISNVITTPEDVLTKYLDSHLLCEVVSQIFIQDYRMYSPMLDLCQAMYTSGSYLIRKQITELISNFTHERLVNYETKEHMTLVNEFSSNLYAYGNDHNALELIDYILSSTSLHMNSEANIKLHHLTTALFNILLCNHTSLNIEKKSQHTLCSTTSILKCFQSLLCVMKQLNDQSLFHTFCRQMILKWPRDNCDLVKSFVVLMEVFLLSIDDPIAFINYPSMTTPTVNSTLFLSLPAPVSAINKCVANLIECVSSLHAKVATTSIAVLRKNNVLHSWVLPFPAAIVTESLSNEQKYRESRLERLVEVLRRNRKDHWCAEVRDTCELFLDDLLDHLAY